MKKRKKPLPDSDGGSLCNGLADWTPAMFRRRTKRNGKIKLEKEIAYIISDELNDPGISWAAIDAAVKRIVALVKK